MVLPLMSFPDPQRIDYSLAIFAHNSIIGTIISKRPFTLRVVMPVQFWVHVKKIDIWMALASWGLKIAHPELNLQE